MVAGCACHGGTHCGTLARTLAPLRWDSALPWAGCRPGPLWFRKADVNGDGDVSRREWLGTEEDFRRIDTDGLISLEEAIKADEWFRKKLQPGK